jgi:predicted PurR-regulated permease PerM
VNTNVEPPAVPDTSSAPAAADAWRRWAHKSIVLIGCVALLGGLHFAKAALVPVMLAAVFALLLSTVVDWLMRRRIPRWLASALVVLALVLAVGGSLNAVWEPARDWLDGAPKTLKILEAKLRPVTRFIAKVESVSTQAGHMAVPDLTPIDVKAVPVREQPRSLVASTQDWAIAILTTLVLTFFLLANGPAMLARLGRRRAPAGGKIPLLELADTVRKELGRYFGAVTISNLVLGVGTALTMKALDMPNPLLWGALAFTLNFVPYAGSAVTFVLLTIVALVSFDGAGKAIAVACAYLALTTFEGQLLQPILVGRRLDLSPLAVFLGLWFGGWLWGIAGVALAMPLLVAAKAAFNASELWSLEHQRIVESEAATVRDRARDWARSSQWRRRGDMDGDRRAT